MSEALPWPQLPPEPKYGWPAVPDNGWSMRWPNYMVTRPWVCETLTEYMLLQLVYIITISWKRKWEAADVRWFQAHLRRCKRAVQTGLSGAQHRGFLHTRPAKTRLNEWRIDLDAIRLAEPFEAGKPAVTTEKKASSRSALRVRVRKHVQSVAYRGEELKRYAQGPLVVASEPAAAACICGECQSAGLFAMPGLSELRVVGDERAKGAEKRTVRSEGKAKGAENRTVPEAVTKCQRFLAAICEHLPRWTYIPGNPVAEKVVQRLGEASLTDFQERCRERGDYLQGSSRPGIFYEFADDCCRAHEQEWGMLCPKCKETRIRTGEICQCSLEPEPPPVPEIEEPSPIWALVRNSLRQQIESTSWQNWIEPTRLLSVNETRLYVAVPDEATRDWILAEYKETVLAAVRERTGGQYTSVDYVIGDEHDE